MVTADVAGQTAEGYDAILRHLAPVMKQSPGFHGYYVFDAGNGIGGSITLFESREAAVAANEKALAWIRASLADLIQGDPEITSGEVLAVVEP